MKESKLILPTSIIALFTGTMMHLITIDMNNYHYGVLFLLIVGLLFALSFMTLYGKRWVAVISMLALLAVTVEYIGIRTCIPYGCFHYTQLLWPRFNDTFPWILLLIWPMLAVSVAHLVPQYLSQYKKIFCWAFLLVLLDLFLDPVIVDQGLRYYENPWRWRWVPWSNFLWWLPMSIITMSIIFSIIPHFVHQKWFRLSGYFLYIFYLSQFFLLVVS
jgi:uncharacterized membrane protein